MLGGKGGFGSQLRAQGGRMSSNRPMNNDSCRDLSGRRLSTLKEAKKLSEHLMSSAERETAEKERKSKIIEKLEQKLEKVSAGPNQKIILGEDFSAQLEDERSAVKNALKEGLRKKKAAAAALKSNIVVTTQETVVESAVVPPI